MIGGQPGRPPSTEKSASHYAAVGQVSLVHASDSVRAVANATPIQSTSANGGGHFAKSTKMSKPPVRVVAPPTRISQQSALGSMQMLSHQGPPQVINQVAPHLNGNTINNNSISSNQLNGGVQKPYILPTLSVPPMSGRSYNELTDFAEQQRKQIESNRREEERRLAMRVQNGRDASVRVQHMRREVADEEGELRRLRELERETRMLRLRNGEKTVEIGVLTATYEEQKRDLREASLRVEALRKQLEEIYRRRQTATAAALVEHRKLQQEQQAQAHRMERVIPVATEVVRPRASVEPFQVITTKTELIQQPQMTKIGVDQMDSTCKEQPPSPPSEPNSIAPGFSALAQSQSTPTVSQTQSRQDTSPSPPKDPHPTMSSSPVNKISEATEGPSSYSAASTLERNLSEKARRDPHQLYNTALVNESDELKVERPTSLLAQSMDESRLRSGRTDAVSLRSDSLKATKRRSWAASEGTFTEAETIKKVIEEQRRGKHHFIPEIPVEESEQTEVLERVQEVEPIVENRQPPAPVESVAASSTVTVDEDTSTTATVTSDEENVEMEISHRGAVKGILKIPGERKPKGNIEFDPLALMLDAALEGEMELVRISAGKLNDVSVANDEGITALHNAICAGHYEIVRFLIERNADVNAQDSDGWTPLHCAASCNNLPMVRQLVEGGACVFASTLSDMETPVEKCEEDEEGYDGCLGYLLAAHRATGSVNNGKVYAAYDYEGEYEDELMFRAGDEIKVVRKDDREKGWWTCERTCPKTGEKTIGLVPKTYISLYPAIRYRERLNFIMFDIPIDSN